jgi:hypothetical protein
VTAVAAVVGDLLVYFVGGLWEVPAEYAALFNPALGASTWKSSIARIRNEQAGLCAGSHRLQASAPMIGR